LREKYPPELVLIEQGFYRFNKSTEVIFRAHGVCNYIFWDVPQVSYAPMTIKKEVVGKGNVTKDEVRDEVINLYPEARDGNYDESDAVAIAVCHFRKNKIGSF
jgi:Holliday junction resolvasome RuvABC endonuclease subunit